MNFEERITINPDVRSGKSCIKGTQITLYDILKYHEDIQSVFSFSAARECKLSISLAG